MTYLEEIAAIRRRLSLAEAECHACRAAGMSDQYLTAYFAAEAIELELNQRLRAGQ
ncbi:MAG TPA: hypothetical protein VGX52_08075 [Burkholderiales bacterium]|nr:hypothetical protein [Burkholderiales bacterium]